MHKSTVVFTFGFLVSSFVMLAVMVFLNNNNSFSNTAFAQGYDDYDSYDDGMYSMYPTEENN
jgi:hypothetical protein